MIWVLSDELFEYVLMAAIFPGTAGLIATGKKCGLRQSVITWAQDVTIPRLMNHLRIDDFKTNCFSF